MRLNNEKKGSFKEKRTSETISHAFCHCQKLVTKNRSVDSETLLTTIWSETNKKKDGKTKQEKIVVVFVWSFEFEVPKPNFL